MEPMHHDDPMKLRSKFPLILTVTLLASGFDVRAAEPKGTKEPARETKTPLDQSNRPEDLKITQAIRKAVMADDSLSLEAKNVQIITADGKVTLRGKVDNPGEKEKVATHARKSAGSMDVVNQIEVEADNKTARK
ncbi:MAG: BON domain-containing protein [Prosthecobacter sp.]|jgi:hyperosmotically inducible protein|nr:BON domain-containing protein [Prosthecobacter sp.]